MIKKENLKKILVVVIIAIVVAININVFAYIGFIRDNREIEISKSILNSNGNLATNGNNTVYYQWVEISKDVYNELDRSRDELQVIQYFNMYTSTEDDGDYETYIASQEYFKNKYGEYLTDFSDHRISLDEEQIDVLLPKYTNNWIEAVNNQYSVDTSSFKGIKNFVLWVKAVNPNGQEFYQAEIFELTGTKQENEEPEQPTQPREEQNSNLLDKNNNIIISKATRDGKGLIEVVALQNYNLYYETVEINEEIYNKIVKLEDELQVIQYFYTYLSTENDEDYDVYASAQEFFKNKYGYYLTDGTEERINSIKLELNELFKQNEYTGKWKMTTDSTYSIDLSKFSGVKHYQVWAKVDTNNGESIYDAEVIELYGTKNENNNEEQNEENNKILDPKNNIIISQPNKNGTGLIQIIGAEDYRLYYQIVEIDENLYNAIQKLKDELQVIQYFNMYTSSEDEEDYETYLSAQEFYKHKYGNYVEDASEKRIDEIEKTIDSLLLEQKYNDNNWTRTDNNNYNMDLSRFSGEKHIIVWAKLIKADGSIVFDGDAFKVIGTMEENNEEENKEEENKEEENKEEENKEEENKQEENKEEENKQEENKEEENKQEENKEEQNNEEENNEEENNEEENNKEENNEEENKKEENNKEENNEKESNKEENNNTENKATGKLPQTGISIKDISIVFSIVFFGIASIISYLRYRKIK